MTLSYEWLREELEPLTPGMDPDDQEIVDLDHRDRGHLHEYRAELAERDNYRMGLVCDDHRSDGRLMSRCWAYIGADGKLPEWMEEDGARIRRVPKWAHAELAKLMTR